MSALLCVNQRNGSIIPHVVIDYDSLTSNEDSDKSGRNDMEAYFSAVDMDSADEGSSDTTTVSEKQQQQAAAQNETKGMTPKCIVIAPVFLGLLVLLSGVAY